MCLFLAATTFYYSSGYQKLSNSHLNVEIANQINTQKDINKLRDMTHHFHNSYKETLNGLSNSFTNFGEILISIAVLCALLIVAIYKSKISNE